MKQQTEKINKVKAIVEVFLWPVLFIIGQFFVTFALSFALQFILIYQWLRQNNLSGDLMSQEISKYMSSSSFQNDFKRLLENNIWIVVLFMLIIFLPIFIKIYHKYNHRKEVGSLKTQMIFPFLGISFVFSFNLGLLALDNVFHTHMLNISQNNTFPYFLILFLSSSIAGPILEEFLFRGIVYEKLKRVLRPLSAMILSSLIFAMFHASISQIIYAFGMGILFTKAYETTQSLKTPIVMHMSVNALIYFVLPFISTLPVMLSTILFFLFLSAFIFLFVIFSFGEKKLYNHRKKWYNKNGGEL